MANKKTKKKTNIWAWVAGILGCIIVGTGVAYAASPEFKDYVNTNILKIEQQVEEDKTVDDETDVDVEVDTETEESTDTETQE